MSHKTLFSLFLAIFGFVFVCLWLHVSGKIVAWGSVLSIIFVVNRAFDRTHHL